jgi:XisI protein
MATLTPKVETHRAIIKQLLTQHATDKPSHEEIATQTIFDRENDHDQIVSVGWDNQQRVYGCSIHIDIKHT